MKKTRAFSLLLTLTMVLTALVLPASAASDPNLTLKVAGQGTDNLTLSLSGLPEQCYGIQMTLTMKTHVVNAGFLFADSLPDAGTYYTSKDTSTDAATVMTLYLTSKAPFTPGEDLDLGVLTGNGEAFTLASVSDVKLITDDIGTAVSVTQGNVSLVEGTGDNSGTGTGTGTGTGSGTGSGSGSGSGNWGTGTGTETTASYSIRVQSGIKNGSVRLSHTMAPLGTEVTITASPEVGYWLNQLTATDGSGKEIPLTDRGDGIFTFQMPRSTVTIQASFVRVENQEPGSEPKPSVELPFTDVKESDWYYSEVEYAYTNGLMTGTSPTTFDPELTTNRAMIVTVLYRLEGEPAPGASVFSDVAAGQWYTDAINWAAANNIVNGYDATTFAPMDNITREQMAAVLYRYAAYKGYDVTARDNLAGFTDTGKVSKYAVEPMQWAVAEKLVNGISDQTGTALVPTGSATRAQIATILMRYCENIAQS